MQLTFEGDKRSPGARQSVTPRTGTMGFII
jgi:hypothetical protein